KDGSDLWVWLESSPLFDDDGHYIGALAMVSDIGERKQAETERERLLAELRDFSAELEHRVKERTRELAAVFEAAPTGMMKIDEEGRMVLVNAEVEALFGYSREELLGKPFSLLCPGAQGDYEEKRHSSNGPSSRRAGTIQLLGRRKEGAEFPIEISM